MPTLSVAIPAYNYADYICTAIDSVLSEPLRDIEIVVVDDHSTDATAEVLRRYADDPRVRVYRNAANLGATANINHAIGLTSGDFVLLLGADDYLEPGALRALHEALVQHPECGFAYGRYSMLQPDGRVFALRHPGWANRSDFGTRNDFALLLEFDCYVNLGATLFRRSVLKDIPFFDTRLQSIPGERFFRATDWDLALRLTGAGTRAAFLDRPISVFRQHATQASGDDNYATPGLALMEHIVLLERHVTGETLARLRPHLAGILHLLREKFNFYVRQGKPSSPAIDAMIRERFDALWNRIQDLSRQAPGAEAEAPTAAAAPIAADPAPLVSVILTTYDRPVLLARAISSVLEQTYSRIEIIVVNDAGAPVEGVVAWAAQKGDVHYIRMGTNRGPSAARNAGIRHARGQVIAYLDDDDVFLADHVATLVDGLRDPHVDFVYTESDYVVERPLHGEMSVVSRRNLNDSWAYAKERLFVLNYIPLNTWGHRRSLIEQIGGFDENLRDHEDWDFLMRLCARGVPRHLPRVTVEVRHRAQADNATERNRGRFHATFVELYARHGDLGSEQVARQRMQVLASLHSAQPAALATPSTQSAPGEGPGVAPPAGPRPWLASHRWLPCERQWMEQAVDAWSANGVAIPSMALAIPGGEGPSREATLASLEAQQIPCASCLVTPGDSGNKTLQDVTRQLIEVDAEWVGLIEAGDRLAPDATFRIAHALSLHPEWQVVYTDEDSLTADGQHVNPHCKPDFNLDYLRSLPYVGGLLLIRRDLFEALGGFDPARDGAEDYDLLLRAWEHLHAAGIGDKAIGHVAEVLYHRLQGSGHTRKTVPEILAAGQEALQGHFERLGIAAQVQPGPFPPSYRVRWPLPEVRPLVSILVPTRDQLPMLQRCIESVIEKTKYPAYEILIIDNGSTSPDAVQYLNAIEAKEAELGGRLRVVRHPGAFNFSAMNNAAARAARGDYLLLLNNDTAALHDDWLDEMMGHAVRPDVGIVGAKLLYPDGKIQHAGVILGMRGPAEHPFIGRPPEDRGYFGRAQLTQNLSAVTGACLLVRKSVYEQVGGLNEQQFAVSYNDIDLCLNVREAGWRIVLTPYALVMHEGSASQKGAVETKPDEAKLKRFAAERDAMYAKWLPQLAFDPAYNRHLSLASTELLLEDQPALVWDPQWRPRPRILVHPADREGCGEYRIIAPLRALNRGGVTQGWETMRLYEPAEMERMNPDSLVVQRQMEWPQIEALERHARHSKAFRVFEIDDLITNLPVKSVHKAQIHKDIAKRFRKAAGICNRLVVATEPLAKAYAGFSDEVVVCPNYLEGTRWAHLRPPRAERARPRVGWAGGVGHTGDLELIVDVVRETAAEVDWVFFGMCPESLKGVVREFHTGIPLDQYPAKLASLDLDLAVAPLEDNPFNEAKSHLRLLEYGVLGYPVICSDLTPYQGDFPVTRVANRFRDWVRAIREAVSDRDALRAQGDALRDKVRADWIMEDHLDVWLRAWTR